MTEASRCIYIVIYPLTGPAANPCAGNGLDHLWRVERPNVYIISLQLVIHYYYACEHWLIATEPYNRIPTRVILRTNYVANSSNQSTHSLVSQPKKFQNLPQLKLQKQKCNLFTGIHMLPKKYVEKTEWLFYFRLNNYRHRYKSLNQNILILVEQPIGTNGHDFN